MSRRIVSLIALLAFSSTPLLAQQACPDGSPRDPAKISEAVDRYAREPFSARTYRVLKGLGDPMIDASYGGYSSWENADKLKKLIAEIAPDAKQPNYYGYECRLGYPLEVLEKRIADLGKTSPYVRQWLTVQLAVLAACDGEKIAELPGPMTDQQSPVKELQEADRAYQQASLAFYTDRTKALDLYKAIGASGSPHKGAARYMVANILANGKQLAEARAEAKAILADPSLAGVHGITKELLGYISNLEDTAPGWTELINSTIAALDKPTKDIQASPQLASDYGRALYDIEFGGIRGKADDWWLDGTLPENPTISKAIVDATRQYPIAAWIIGGQSTQEYYERAPWQVIGPKWEARTQSLVDRSLALVAGMPPLAKDVIEALKAKSDDASRKALWDKAVAAARAANDSCGTAPETAAAGTLLTHAVRVSALAGKFDEAYDGLASYPVKGSVAYMQNAIVPLGQYILGQGMVEEARKFRDRLLTDDLWASLDKDEGSRNVLAQIAMWAAEDRAQWNKALAHDSVKTGLSLLNFLPAKDLRAMAKDEALFTPEERALLIRTAWTRLYARGRVPEKSFTEELYALNPDVKAVADQVKVDYPKAKEANQRLLTILRTPRMGILVNAPGIWEPITMTGGGDVTALDSFDHNDKNWWCPFEPDRQLGGLRGEFDSLTDTARISWSAKRLEPVIEADALASLAEKRDGVLKDHPVVKSVSWNEIKALSAMPSAPKLLATAATKWGKAAPRNDARNGAAEALALAVKATRYGCNWHGGHGKYSRAAYEVLQERYGTTPWATQTPYWFDCVNFYDQTNTTGGTCPSPSWPKQEVPR
ncbi:hypothetical protein G5V57_28605 [Nordella sp. HKS 07]|uniref:hypothetical protein n=1 Tax=Nordella sp. HKS 07 TaxID=2712222 RepID=UPI0013E191DD|nr:hypothetical protein [Nordella sp. HKS 07]QIG51329.1 hypothetical protein G5V57_28605 [Nordella sp. HKS 07]